MSILRVVVLSIVLTGCTYEASICEESPGSGCGECSASCYADFEHDHHDQARLDECEAGCSEGEWVFGLRACGN